jgi:hypothetical protein
LKTVGPQGPGGSNPSLSAISIHKPLNQRGDASISRAFPRPFPQSIRRVRIDDRFGRPITGSYDASIARSGRYRESPSPFALGSRSYHPHGNTTTSRYCLLPNRDELWGQADSAAHE